MSHPCVIAMHGFSFRAVACFFSLMAFFLAPIEASEFRIRGVVQSGAGTSAIPLRNAAVTLYEATTGQPRSLGTATSGPNGGFLIRTKHAQATSNSVYFVTANLSSRIQLITIVGPQLRPFVTVNELTTVCSGYAMAQLTKDSCISGQPFPLRLATGMFENLVTPETGNPAPVMLNSPNGDETNSLRSTRSLANLVASFVRSGGTGVEAFYDLATGPGQPRPRNFLQAFSNLARNPGHEVTEIYDLTRNSNAYEPALERQPDAWSIVVKVNDSGDDQSLFSGPGNLVFDQRGYAWITNNTIQGTPNSSNFAVVLKPNGKPADGVGGTPRSPLFGGGLLGGGFGVGIAPNGTVWFGNFGWGSPQYWPMPGGNGSASQFTLNGRPISGPLGYQGGVWRAQASVPDRRGNIWFTSFGDGRVVVFLNGNPNRTVSYAQSLLSMPFDIRIARDDSAWVTYSGGLDADSPSALA